MSIKPVGNDKNNYELKSGKNAEKNTVNEFDNYLDSERQKLLKSFGQSNRKTKVHGVKVSSKTAITVNFEITKLIKEFIDLSIPKKS